MNKNIKKSIGIILGITMMGSVYMSLNIDKSLANNIEDNSLHNNISLNSELESFDCERYENIYYDFYKKVSSVNKNNLENSEMYAEALNEYVQGIWRHYNISYTNQRFDINSIYELNLSKEVEYLIEALVYLENASYNSMYLDIEDKYNVNFQESLKKANSSINKYEEIAKFNV